jgi:hypothetical protein
MGESFTEWGVRWDGGFWSPSTQPLFGGVVDHEEAVREFAKGIPADRHPVVVCRTVTRAEWREVARSEDESPAQYDRRLCRSCQQPEWPTHVADAPGGTVKHPYVAPVGTDG